MAQMRILVTCPPMLGMIDSFRSIFEEKNIELLAPKVVQTMTEEELMELLPTVDGWIIGDDPATERVFVTGKAGKLRAAVKWGVGVDNVDFDACKKLDIPIINTPNMFGNEVADVAVAYVIGLARQVIRIHNGVKNNEWLKPIGMSLTDKKVALIGYGDIGQAVARRLAAFDMNIRVYDPFANEEAIHSKGFIKIDWPEHIADADFVVITCALNKETQYMINKESLAQMKKGVRIINVSRGGIINEADLIEALHAEQVHSAALDVFEEEPLPADSALHSFEKCIFGTHNGSNTKEGVIRASHRAIDELFGFLNIK